MANTLKRNHDEPAAGEKANQQWPGVECRSEQFPERGVQDRFEVSDLKAILSPTTQPAAAGRKPLFRR
jgi:hypothetical protein